MNTNTLLKKIALVGLFAIPFVVLFVYDFYFFPFISGKNFTFRILVEVVAAVWLILAYRDRTYLPKFSWLGVAVTAFVIIVGIADLFSENALKSFWSNFERMEGFVTIAHLFVYFFVASALLNVEKLWSRFFHTWFGIGIFLSLYGFLQKVKELQTHQGDLRIDATLGNSIYLAVLMLFFILLAFYYATKHRENILPIISSYMIGAGLMIVYPVYMYLNAFAQVKSLYGSVPAQYDAKFFMGNYEMTFFIIAFFVLALLGYLWTLHKSESKVQKQWLSGVLYSIYIVVSCVTLYLTGTRGTVLGLIGGVAVACLLVAVFSKKKVQKNIACGLIALVLVIVGVFNIFKDSEFVRNNPLLYRFTLISLEETKTQSRSLIWPMALKGAMERPILGWGQESFNFVFNKHYSPKMYNVEQWFDRVHNVPLDWLIAAGVFGMLGYLSFFVLALYYIWGKKDYWKIIASGVPSLVIAFLLYKYSLLWTTILAFAAYIGTLYLITRKLPLEREHILTEAIFTALIMAYFVHNLFVFDNIASYIIFFSVLAYIHSQVAPHKEIQSLSRLPAPSEGTGRLVAVVVTVLVVLLLWFGAVRPIFENRALLRGLNMIQMGQAKKALVAFKEALSYNIMGRAEILEHLSNASLAVARAGNVDTALKSEFLSLAVSEYSKYADAHKNDARVQVIFGSFLEQISAHDQAAVHIERAAKLSPNKQTILFSLASNYFYRGQFDMAIATAKKAYDLEPTYTGAKNFLDQINAAIKEAQLKK